MSWNLEGKTKIKLKKISSIFFFSIFKNWVGRVGKTKNKKTLALGFRLGILRLSQLGDKHFKNNVSVIVNKIGVVEIAQ